MRRTFGERLAVGLSGKFLDLASMILEEIALPSWLLLRWARGKIPAWMAWHLFRSTWKPFKFCRRWRARRQVREDRAYRGHDEFHHSLDMNLAAMLTMTDAECSDYLADLARRRQSHHENDISRRT